MNELLSLMKGHTSVARCSLILWTAAQLLVSLPANAQEQFTHTTNNGAITVTGYTGPGGDVVIPEAINGLPVVAIGYSAFRGSTTLTAITLPDTVQTIGGSAFASCRALSSANLGNGVRDVALMAFSESTNLASVSWSATLTNIGPMAFLRTRLTEVAFPATLISIGDFAFQFCHHMSSITLPEGLVTIKGFAFDSCSSLMAVTIPRSVTSLGVGVFELCTNLVSITVDPMNSEYSSADGILFNNAQTTLIQYPCGKPGSYTVPVAVTNIADIAFVSCVKLAAITVDATSAFYSSSEGVLFNKNATVLLQCPGGWTGEYRVPSTVTNISALAFLNSRGVSRVTLPATVKSIGAYTFEYCTGLTGIYFEGNPSTLGESPFYGANLAKAYFLSATPGGSATFGGIPAMVWTPEIRTNDGHFGVQTNAFGFRVQWADGRAVAIEACNDLANPHWSSLKTNTLVGGVFYFSDSEVASFPNRFFRLRSP